MLTGFVHGAAESDKRPLWKGLHWFRVALVIIVLFAYALLLPILGYLVATSGLLALLFGVIRGTRLWAVVAGALFTALASYAVFNVWLQVQLPRGLFGF
jgi:putative tricarboxylic transport membrane protein